MCHTRYVFLWQTDIVIGNKIIQNELFSTQIHNPLYNSSTALYIKIRDVIVHTTIFFRTPNSVLVFITSFKSTYIFIFIYTYEIFPKDLSKSV